MDDNDRVVDDAVRRLIHAPKPSEADKRHALARLSKAIDRESRRKKLAPGRLIPVAAVALALLVVSLLVVDSLRMTPVMAAFEEIAEALDQAEPQLLADSEFFYLASEEIAIGVVPAEILTDVNYAKPELVYRLTSKREVWYGNREAVQIRTTNTGVDFFSPEDRDAYFDAGLDESLDRLGEPATVAVTEEEQTDWPNNPADLDTAIAQAAQGDRSPTVEYVDTALDIVRDPRNPPDVRAATFRLVGDLEEVEVLESDPSAVTFGIDFQERDIRHRLTFRITSDGTLREESVTLLDPDPVFGLPDGAQVRGAQYGDIEIVDRLPSARHDTSSLTAEERFLVSDKVHVENGT